LILAGGREREPGKEAERSPQGQVLLLAQARPGCGREQLGRRSPATRRSEPRSGFLQPGQREAGGEALLRERVAALDDGRRRVLREALDVVAVA
jgi:hypothetical protein